MAVTIWNVVIRLAGVEWLETIWEAAAGGVGSLWKSIVSSEIPLLSNLASLAAVIGAVLGICAWWKKRSRNVPLPDGLKQEEMDQYTTIYIKTKLCRTPYDWMKSSDALRDIDWFIRAGIEKSRCQYFWVLAESGMGKTAFMINLYCKYYAIKKRKYRHIVYISMRRNTAFPEIEALAEKQDAGQTVLLLDAFDESLETAEKSIEAVRTLEYATECFGKVIVTSRMHFFNSVSEEPNVVHIMRAVLLEEEKAAKLYIAPFSDQDVNRYLRQKYGMNIIQMRNAKKVIEKSTDVWCRPLFLSYMDDLLEKEDGYEYSHQIYMQIIRKWIQREAIFYEQWMEKNHPGDERIGKDQYENRYFGCILKVVQQIYGENISIYGNAENSQPKENLNQYAISVGEFERIADEYGVVYPHQRRSRALLNRIADSTLGFSHKSVYEYFLSVAIAKGANLWGFYGMTSMQLDQCLLFLRELYQMRELGGALQKYKGQILEEIGAELEKQKVPASDRPGMTIDYEDLFEDHLFCHLTIDRPLMRLYYCSNLVKILKKLSYHTYPILTSHFVGKPFLAAFGVEMFEGAELILGDQLMRGKLFAWFEKEVFSDVLFTDIRIVFRSDEDGSYRKIGRAAEPTVSLEALFRDSDFPKMFTSLGMKSSVRVITFGEDVTQKSKFVFWLKSNRVKLLPEERTMLGAGSANAEKL